MRRLIGFFINYVILLITGIFAGGIGALIGVGGGFIVIPVMFLGLDMPAQAVVGISLTMVFFNALSSSITYWRQKRIDLTTGWKFTLATIPGAILGSQLAAYFTNQGFGVTFGLVLILVAVLMFFRGDSREAQSTRNIQQEKKRVKETAQQKTERRTKRAGWVERVYQDAEGKVHYYSFNEYLGIGLSLGVGFLSSALGIGGGIIHVPLMVMLMHFPPHVATATSLFILTGSSLVGSISHLFLGHFVWPPAIALSIGGILGAQIISRQSVKIKGRNIIKVFAVVLFLVGWQMMLG